MYSRNSSGRRADEGIELPARYSGVRFNREEPMEQGPVPKAETVPEKVERTVERGLHDVLGNIGSDDLLLAALVIILTGEGIEDNREMILLLLLLLCIR